MWSRLTSHEELLSLEEKATVLWMPVGICNGLVHSSVVNYHHFLTSLPDITFEHSSHATVCLGGRSRFDVGHISSLTLDVQPIGLINSVTCGSAVRNATPNPTLYLKSDKWWAGNSEGVLGKVDLWNISGKSVLAKLCSNYVTMKPSREFNGKETKLCKKLQRIPF